MGVSSGMQAIFSLVCWLPGRAGGDGDVHVARAHQGRRLLIRLRCVVTRPHTLGMRVGPVPIPTTRYVAGCWSVVECIVGLAAATRLPHRCSWLSLAQQPVFGVLLKSWSARTQECNAHLMCLSTLQITCYGMLGVGYVRSDMAAC